MKILLLSVFSLFAITAIASTEPVTGGEIDIASSTINWTGKKVTGQHQGTIALKSGKLKMENGELKGGMFEVDMTTIEVTDLQGGQAKKLQGHLSSDDFFGVATHPVAKIEITKAKKTSANTYDITANATIKGITNEINFVATKDGDSISANIVIDRSKYDVKYGSGSFFDGLGDKMIYDDFELSVNLVMSK